jgi:hypothetical protein
MTRALVFTLALALAGCASFAPTARGPTTPQVAPIFACQTAAWRALAQTTDVGTPEGWWRATDAAKFAPQSGVCCWLPDNSFGFCPTALGLTYAPLDDYNKARQKAATAQPQGQTPAAQAPAK